MEVLKKLSKLFKSLLTFKFYLFYNPCFKVIKEENRIVYINDICGFESEIEYNPQGQKIRYSRFGIDTFYHYDDCNNLIYAESSNGDKAIYNYDINGNYTGLTITR